MNYIDERDLINEDSGVCKYAITHIHNDLIMEINHLKITKPLSLDEFFDCSREEIIIVFKNYIIVGMHGYYEFDWRMFRDLKEFQEYIGLDDDEFQCYYKRPSILKQLKEQDPQIINFLQCDI